MTDFFDIKAKRLDPVFLAWLQARVREDAGGCWEWRLSAKDGSQPQGKYLGNVINVRRQIVEQVTGKPLPRGWVAVERCECKLCVRPGHQIGISRSEAFKGKEFSVLHKAKLAASAQARSKISREVVERIRAEPGTAVAKAQVHGIHVKYVRDILNFKVWKDYSSPFSGLILASDKQRSAA